MSNQVMHVGIEEPVQRRKEVLNIAIDAIQTLKDFEIEKKYSKEKSVYRKHFIQIVKELSNTIGEFREMMPAVHVHHPKEEAKEEEMPKAKPIVVKKPVKKRAKTHLDKLEDDISSLREKIAGL